MNKSKSILLSVMVLVLLVHIFGHVLVMVHYKLNKEFITATFCENKARPKINCNGKCHLKKTIKQLTTHSKNNSSKPTIELSQYIIFKSYTSLTIFFSEIKIEYTLAQFKSVTVGHHSKIFHPPLV